MATQSICAIVVTHRPDTTFRERLQALAPQVAHSLVIYNGFDSVPGDGPHGDHRTLLAHPVNNLSAAQNLGIRWAREHGHSHILLMDDDSTPSATMVTQLIATLPAKGIAVANLQEEDTPRALRHVVSENGYWGWPKRIHRGETLPNIVTAIASGSLIPLSVIEQVGLMDEQLVIDYIDKEFCLRLRSRGYSITMAGDAVLHHRIGKASKHGPVTCLNHSPERRYTIWRNRAICIGRYSNCFTFVAFDLAGMVYDLIRVIGFESNKKHKLLAMWHGLIDAFSGQRRSTTFPVRTYG